MKLIIHSSCVRPDERANARNVRISKSFTVVIRPLSTCLRKPNFHVLIFETVFFCFCFCFFIWRYKFFNCPPIPGRHMPGLEWTKPTNKLQRCLLQAGLIQQGTFPLIHYLTPALVCANLLSWELHGTFLECRHTPSMNRHPMTLCT